MLRWIQQEKTDLLKYTDTEGTKGMDKSKASNPRYHNGNLRRKHRQRFKAMCLPCGICKGKLGEIDYSAPSDSKHPLSFVIDEIVPISKWKEAGYNSATEAAQDWNNLQPAHYICNQMKSNKTNFTLDKSIQTKHAKGICLDGQW